MRLNINTKGNKNKTKNKKKKTGMRSDENRIRVSSKKNSFNETEAFRQLRTNIEFSSFSKEMKVVSVTSSNPGEGKSSIATNLALIATAKYDRVLLIDCDLRKPVQHKVFKISNRMGVSGIVKELNEVNFENNEYFTKLQYGDFSGHLYVLPAGMHVPNPQELLASDKFRRLIDGCRENFDFVVVDCPPLNAVADAIPVSNVCDGTVFVLSAKDTDKRAAKNALTELKRAGGNVIGCVLNKAEATEKKYYNYQYGYGATKN